jgi:predicted O-methyltransferase YrrM
MSSRTSRLSTVFVKTSQTISTARAILIAGLLGGNLATIALLRRPSAALSYVQYGLFGWRMLAHQGLPQHQFHDLFPTPAQVSVELLPTTSYPTWWDANYTKDMLYLILLAKVLSAQTIFEIGTLHGYTALLFALNTSPETTIYTLDLPPDASTVPALSTTMMDTTHIALHANAAQYLYVSHPMGSKVRQIYGDSARFDFSSYREKVDLFFVDGAHSYEYVRSDTQQALACVRPGGVIAWHDYGRWGVNGVSRWLHELARSGRDICRLPGSSLAILKV